MPSSIEIKPLGATEIRELNMLIPEFVKRFSSHSQRFVKEDFENFTTSRKLTMRILCKLSEWCNTEHKDKEAKTLAIKISTILFGDKLPYLHPHLVTIENAKIITKL